MGSCCVKVKLPKEMSIGMVDMEQDWPPIGSPFMSRVLNQACQTSMINHPYRHNDQSATMYVDASYVDGNKSFLYYDNYALDHTEVKLQSPRLQFVQNHFNFANSQLCLADDDILNNGLVMVKSYKEEQLEDVKRMIKEAEILRSLHHANVVKFQDFYLSPSGYYRLVGRCDGTQLSDLIEERNNWTEKSPLSPLLIMTVSRQMAEVLSYLHNDEHLLHGNVSSSNVYINMKSMNVILAGFEYSLKLDTELKSLYPDVKYEGELIRSPKEAVDGLRLTHKCDMFGFGLLIFEMLTLSQPFADLKLINDGADFNSMTTNLFEKLGTRPPLIRFRYNRTYTDCILLFVNCTHQLAELRPSAVDICQAFNNSKGFILPTY